MFKSKALKPSTKQKSSEMPQYKFNRFLSAARYLFLVYAYYPIESFLSMYWERSMRSLAFAKHGWLSFDFDSAYIFNLMAFKLKRIYKCLENDRAIQTKENMDSLKEAINICECLFDYNYDDKYHKAHDKKWGQLKNKDTPIYDEDGKVKHYVWDSYRNKVKTPQQKQTERKEFLKCFEDGEKDRRADLDRLNILLKDKSQDWWS